MNAAQRLWSSFPFLIALTVLLFLGWGLWLAFSQPADGILYVNPTGTIQELDLQGPAYTKLQLGDTIVSIDGVQWEDAQPPYGSKHAGETARMLIERQGQNLLVTINLVDPPFDELLLRIAPLLVGLVFWLVGVGFQSFRSNIETTGVFFIFFQAAALLLLAGASTTIGPAWTSAVLSVLLWLIGPLMVHFHTQFPQDTNLPYQRAMLAGLYTIAVIGCIPYILYSPQDIRASSWYPQYSAANRIFLAINFLLVVALLVYSYRHATTAGVRGKIRIVVLGGAISLLPLVTLVILPDALYGQTIIPYSFLFLFLAILPLTYGYAIFRHRLIEIERQVNRGATFILVYSILGGFYLVLYALLDQTIPDRFEAGPVINTVLVLILASAFVPLYRQIKHIVDSVFYGGWYDYRSAVMEITQGLEQISELHPLARFVSERLVKILHLQDCCVFLKDHEGNISVIEVAPLSNMKAQETLKSTPLPRSSFTYLIKIGDMEKGSLREALSGVRLTQEEHQLLNTEQDHLWIPVVGHGEVQGLLALGPKFGGDIFSSEDMDILRVVSRQLGPVVENIHLVTRLRKYAAELEERVKERTAELHEAKERVEAVLASVGDGVILTDLDGTILTINTAYEEQSGYTTMELVGENLHEILAGYNDPKILSVMQTTLPEGKVWRGELVNQRKDGTPYDIQLTIAPVRDQSGQMVYYVGSQRDITRQKELDRMKDRFVSDVSHELRTPTTNISLYLELMDHAPVEKRTEYLSVLRDQGYQLRKLVEDILDLSRLSMGRERKIEFGPVDINLVAAQVVTAHQPLADATGLSLDLLAEADLPPVRGEENQLARVITNLVSNAVRYTDKGSVNVRTFHNGQRICLEVQDTGMGIDPEDRPHLFERFYRGRRVRQTRIHGTGLGLAIVKEIVDQHDGYIDVNSYPGEGSTFRIWIPMYMD